MLKKWIKYLKINIFISLLLIIISFFTLTGVYASETKYVIPGGDAIGLKIDTGVYVIGKYNVLVGSAKLMPWKNSDIEEGDRIISLNNKKIYSIDEMLDEVKKAEEEFCNLTIKRGNENIETKIDIVKTKNGEKTIGLYLKDKLLGIGTLTFIDPDTNKFASLGHGVYDKTLTYGDVSGCVVTSCIESIKKGVPGVSGEKRASLSSNKIGSISLNNNTGLYGNISENVRREKIAVGKQWDVHKGKAKMLTVINGDEIESFDIEIVGITLQDSTGTKGLKVKVIDERLISEAGGIVQGMSGSPIIQDNKLVGAISHVSVSEPTIGYAMHIGWMIEELSKF